MLPVWGIPQHPKSAREVLSVADLILKHLQEALASAPIRAIELGSTATSMALGHPPRHFFCFLSPFFLFAPRNDYNIHF
jgi:hypothetical protein